jgi:hypothetical protein
MAMHHLVRLAYINISDRRKSYDTDEYISSSGSSSRIVIQHLGILRAAGSGIKIARLNWPGRHVCIVADASSRTAMPKGRGCLGQSHIHRHDGARCGRTTKEI